MKAMNALFSAFANLHYFLHTFVYTLEGDVVVFCFLFC